MAKQKIILPFFLIIFCLFLFSCSQYSLEQEFSGQKQKARIIVEQNYKDVSLPFYQDVGSWLKHAGFEIVGDNEDYDVIFYIEAVLTPLSELYTNGTHWSGAIVEGKISYEQANQTQVWDFSGKIDCPQTIRSSFQYPSPDRAPFANAYTFGFKPVFKNAVIELKGSSWLINMLKNSDLPGNRMEAARELGEIGDVSAVKPLTAALKDKTPGVRSSAASALGEIGDFSAVKPLTAALKDREDVVRISAASALGEIGDVSAVRPLIIALKDVHVSVRKNAAEALGEIGDVSAVKPLTAALDDKNSDVRKAAKDALKKIGHN